MNNTELRQRLAALRWSQQQLADALGVSKGYVSHLLHGDVPVTDAIAAALDAAVDAMLTVRGAS